MHGILASLVVFMAVGLAMGAGPEGVAPQPDPAALRGVMERVQPLFEKKGEPKAGEWLARFKEPGQSFAEYLRSDPPTATKDRTVLYIQPLGEFSRTQSALVADTADFMGRFYGVKIQTLEALPLKVIPEKHRRVHPTWGDKQIRSTYVLEMLTPRVPKDAVALIALTTSDLFPEDDWNFVLGQASLKDRVGVWSLYRYGDPEKEYPKALLRTIKVASHETGHMVGIWHCTAYECGMNGSNSLPETDRCPLEFCPECAAKVWWAYRADAGKRYAALREFCAGHKLEAEAKRYEKLREAVKGSGPAATARKP